MSVLSRAVTFTYFFSSWYKGSSAVLATCCLHLCFECILCVCTDVYFLVASSCGHVHASHVPTLCRLQLSPTRPLSFLPSVENWQTNGSLGACAAQATARRGGWMGENIWTPDQCLIRRFFSVFYKSADKQ